MGPYQRRAALLVRKLTKQFLSSYSLTGIGPITITMTASSAARSFVATRSIKALAMWVRNLVLVLALEYYYHLLSSAMWGRGKGRRRDQRNLALASRPLYRPTFTRSGNQWIDQCQWLSIPFWKPSKSLRAGWFRLARLSLFDQLAYKDRSFDRTLSPRPWSAISPLVRSLARTLWMVYLCF